ncbi:hypothetical protein DsansV1_C01g0011681 [Dioscorea sansibarensis]
MDGWRHNGELIKNGEEEQSNNAMHMRISSISSTKVVPCFCIRFYKLLKCTELFLREA